MRSLHEKPRVVIVFRPDLVFEDRDEELLAKLQESYLEIKAQKQVYLTESEAGQFVSDLPEEQRGATIELYALGLSSVVVVEHLEDDVLQMTADIVEALCREYGEGSIYTSRGLWEAERDMEFFFPHLDGLPVERTLALIKPDALGRGLGTGKTVQEVVIDEAAAVGLFVVGQQQLMLSVQQAELLTKEWEETPEAHNAMSVLLQEPGAIALCLEGRGAIGKWKLLCGPTSSNYAKEIAPTTLRARFGTDSTSNAVYCSSSHDEADAELAALFPPGSFQLQRTLLLIKPDAMANLLEIITALGEVGFTILKEKQTLLTEERAQEFYRDLKNKPSFRPMIKHACSGPCCLLVLCRLGAITVLKQLVGPEIVKDAKATRPKSLRARFGRDGQRNAVHCSDNAKSAAREVRFFFPEMGADPIPNDDEVRDFIFRKSAGASMDFKTLSEVDSINFDVDQTLQQLLSRGLMALCQVQPKGLTAVKWLSRWLIENNPNKKKDDEETAGPEGADKTGFHPPERTRRYIEYGVNPEGMPFAVEAPAAPHARKKQIIEVDVSEETEDQRVSEFVTPPFVVFVVGGPGCGKGTQCSKLREEFSMIHLSTGDLMREEVSAQTFLGNEIYKHMQNGTLVPDHITLQLLKNAMTRQQDVNRFLLDGFPRTVEQAKRFEQEIAEVAFVLYFEATAETMQNRIKERSLKTPGRVDDNPETVKKRITSFEEQTVPVEKYYFPIGKVRRVQSEQSIDEVTEQTRQYFRCRFIYLLGPPGSPLGPVAARFEKTHKYCKINFVEILQKFASSEDPDAGKVQQALAKGKPVEPSIACPLIISEISIHMSLGVNNFVLCHFPQSAKQLEFLEFRIPSVTKTFLLDYSRADAQDLSSIVAPDGGVEARANTFFHPTTDDMLKSLDQKGCVKHIPCSLAELDYLHKDDAGSTTMQDQLIEKAWQGVSKAALPGLTVVLGPPSSGTALLAQLLAGKTPNSYWVDCNQLLDKELERRTEIGTAMHNMLARGQVVPLATTLELLKGIVNLTCSDSLVVENCPLYADQLEYIVREFRVDRAYHIRGSDEAVQGWREKYLAKSSGDDPTREASLFDERVDSLSPIITYFGRQGRLETLDVTETPKPEKLKKLIEQVTLPQVAVVSGLSAQAVKEQAELLAAAFGGPPLTSGFVSDWAEINLKKRVDPSQHAEFLWALKEYGKQNPHPILVLEQYPWTADGATAIYNSFGAPKVFLSIDCEDEQRMEDYRAAHEEEEIEDEDLAAKLGEEREQYKSMVGVFESRCARCLHCVSLADIKSPEELSMSVRQLMRPRAYVIMAPCGKCEFGRLLSDAICNSQVSGKCAKYTVIDCASLLESGVESSDLLKHKLYQASFTASGSRSLPVPLQAELFSDVFSRSANPMGTFIITNFPAPCTSRLNPTLRDQFCMLESICTIMGFLHVKLDDDSYTRWCSADPAELAAQKEFYDHVRDCILVQFGANKLFDSSPKRAPTTDEAVRRVAQDFLTCQAKAERTA